MKNNDKKTTEEMLKGIKEGTIFLNSSDVNASYILGSEKDTLLHMASRNLDAELIKLLVKMNAKLDLENDSKFTPLFSALNAVKPEKGPEQNKIQYAKQEEAVRTLLDLNANPNALDKNEENTLWPAVDSGNQKVVELLVEAKADLSHKDDPAEGDTIVSFVQKFKKYNAPQYEEVMTYLGQFAAPEPNNSSESHVTGEVEVITNIDHN